MKKIIFIIFPVVALSFAAWYYFYAPERALRSKGDVFAETAVAVLGPASAPLTDRLQIITIEDGHTFGALMAETGIPYALANSLYETAQPHYDLAKIRSGRMIELTFDKDHGDLKNFAYKIDTENELCISRELTAEDPGQNGPVSETGAGNGGNGSQTDFAPTPWTGWTARVEPIPYAVVTKTAAGRIETSMYQAALDNNIDIRAIIELADAFQWTIDFAMDPRRGDTFKMVYEKRYLNGEYAMPGRIFAGEYINDGTKHEVYYFRESDDNTGFFDAAGNSVQKMFLKAPVAFKYISSGFTTGLRYIQAFNISTGHRAIDYAAAAGTPIRAVGDGTVIFAGRNGAYGYMTSVRHNGTYTTNYAHQSKIAVKVGQKVKQGQVIGYVGSTGLSTGPHLHYEMVKNGVKVNPLREVLPPGEPIKEENKERFFEAIKPFKDMLNLD